MFARFALASAFSALSLAFSSRLALAPIHPPSRCFSYYSLVLFGFLIYLRTSLKSVTAKPNGLRAPGEKTPQELKDSSK